MAKTLTENRGTELMPQGEITRRCTSENHDRSMWASCMHRPNKLHGCTSTAERAEGAYLVQQCCVSLSCALKSHLRTRSLLVLQALVAHAFKRIAIICDLQHA